MKYHIHKRFVWPTLFCGVCTIFFAKQIQKYGPSIEMYVLFSIGLFLVGAGLFYLWKNRNNTDTKTKSTHDLQIEITNSEILFPNGYFFEHSPIHKSKRIAIENITEVNLRTWPVSVVINDNEVIFLRHDQTEQLKAFSFRNNLPVIERFDIWEHLSHPFLDTEFEKSEQEKTIEQLAKNGVSPEETKSIRKKMGRFYYIASMEWIYLGQYDYLQSRRLTEEKYWRVNEIALRNYKSGKVFPSTPNPENSPS